MGIVRNIGIAGALLVGTAGVNETYNNAFMMDEPACSPLTNLERVVESESLIKNEDYRYLRAYEAEIVAAVELHNEGLGLDLDPIIPLAMIYVESGSILHRQTAFRYNPMQVKSARKIIEGDLEKIPLIKEHIGEDYFKNLNPVKEGVTILYNYAIRAELQTIESGHFLSHTVKPGDNLWDISLKKGTTMKTLEKYNPEMDLENLMPEEVLLFRQAKEKRVMTGVDEWDQAVVDYNGLENPNYLARVQLAMAEITRSSK